MRSKNAQADIRALVDSFVDELTQHIRTAAVEAVHSALLGGGAPRASSGRPKAANGKKAAKKAKRAGKARKGGRRVRRSSAEISAAKAAIRQYVQANPGTAMGELSRALGDDPAVIRMQLNELLGEGALRKEGERRGTKYYAGKGRASGKAKGAKKTKRKKATRKKARK